MRRIHIKNFQSEQYKVADRRVNMAAHLAWRILLNIEMPEPDWRQFKRYQII